MSNLQNFKYKLKQLFEENKHFRNLSYTLLFGGLSLVAGELKFYIPEFEGGASDFREIPLLIAVFYIDNPVYFLLVSLITALGVPGVGTYTSAFAVHFIGLVAAWLFFVWMEKYDTSNVIKGMQWIFFTLAYYLVFVVPSMVVFNYWLGLSENLDFIDTYVYLSNSVKFEVIATAMVTSLYFMQFKARKALETHKVNLEIVVGERTKEIAEANGRLIALNEELMASSEQIRSMNENLDELVKERSKKIEEQLQILVRYAHMNSHDVRAPLARILGLLYLIDKEDKDSIHVKTILKMLYTSSLELDEVVKKMNRLLEREIMS